MLADAGKSFVRVTSFMGKELREVVRRPGVLASVVLGPFFVMLIFGIGYTGYRQPFDAEIVIPPGSELPTDPEYYQGLSEGRFNVTYLSDDEAAARERLRRQVTEILVVVPDDAAERLRNGEQSVLEVAWNQVDPVNDSLAHLATSIVVSELNSEIIRQAASEGISLARAQGVDELADIPPDVIARPTRAETTNVAPTRPEVISFFGPAVFALVLQHLAVTLTALSMVRERLGGQMDLFRVAPVNSMEVLVGKYVAYAVLSLAVSAAVVGLMVYALGVPLLSGWPVFAGIVLLLTFASLGVGLLISLVADSERQAVQLSMLVLLASVFFSGFVLPPEEFVGWVRYAAYALPVTHGIELLQQGMLRGELRNAWMLGALGGLGVLLYLGSLMRLRRVLRRAD